MISSEGEQWGRYNLSRTSPGISETRTTPLRLDDDGLCLARHLLEEALRRHLAGLADMF